MKQVAEKSKIQCNWQKTFSVVTKQNVQFYSLRAQLDNPFKCFFKNFHNSA